MHGATRRGDGGGNGDAPAPGAAVARVGDADDDYAAAYADEPHDEEEEADTGDQDDDDDDDEDAELAAMFAKVQNIQQAEGIHVAAVRPPPVRASASNASAATPFEGLEVTIPDRTATVGKPGGGGGAAAPMSATASAYSSSSSQRTRSPGANSVAGADRTRSPDGITTISRRTVSGNGTARAADVLLGAQKPAFYQDRLLQTVKQQPQTLEQLKQKVVAAAPATIAKRIESLSEPKKKDTGRKFAQDDDERHCRFRARKKRQAQGSEFDDDNGGSGQDRSSDFIARMEAAERNKQKKLELTRGEKEYLANLNKKVCPKCDVQQSYSEFRDKKKRCQSCGSEFRLPNAWGDVGSEFIGRIAEDSRIRDARKEQIRAQVVGEETASGRVPKSATQQYYEKQLEQRNDQRTFLDRNYKPASSSSNSKTQQAHAQMQQLLQSQRAKLLAAAQPPII